MQHCRVYRLCKLISLFLHNCWLCPAGYKHYSKNYQPMNWSGRNFNVRALYRSELKHYRPICRNWARRVPTFSREASTPSWRIYNNENKTRKYCTSTTLSLKPMVNINNIFSPGRINRYAGSIFKQFSINHAQIQSITTNIRHCWTAWIIIEDQGEE